MAMSAGVKGEKGAARGKDSNREGKEQRNREEEEEEAHRRQEFLQQKDREEMKWQLLSRQQDDPLAQNTET